MNSFNNTELMECINQARDTELFFEERYFADKCHSTELDYCTSMTSLNILVEEAMERGLIQGPLDVI